MNDVFCCEFYPHVIQMYYYLSQQDISLEIASHITKQDKYPWTHSLSNHRSQHRRGVVKSHTVFYTGGGWNQTEREVTQYHYNIKNIFMPFQLHGIIFGDLDFRLRILLTPLSFVFKSKTFSFEFKSIFSFC